MELEQAEDILKRLPTSSRLVEVRYAPGGKSPTTKPCYFSRIWSEADIKNIPEAYRNEETARKCTKAPFAIFYPELDRNQCNTGTPIEIELEYIIYIYPLGIVKLNSETPSD